MSTFVPIDANACSTRGARALADRDHGDHRRDADDHPERGQQRAHLVAHRARSATRMTSPALMTRRHLRRRRARRPPVIVLDQAVAHRRSRARAWAAMSGSCVTRTMVMPSPPSSWSSAIISTLVRESRLPVGSSARMTLRLVDQRARDRHALLLAARELARVVVAAARRARRAPAPRGARAPALARAARRRRSAAARRSRARVVRASRLKLWNTKPSVRLRISASASRVQARDLVAGQQVAARSSAGRGSRGCSSASTCRSRTAP